MKETLFLSEPGIACAAGNNAADFWRSLTTGSQDGLVKVKTHSGREFYAAKIAGGALKKTSARYDMRAIQIEDAALEQIAPAVQAAKQKYGASRIAVCVGCCDNGSELSVAGHREYFEKGAFPKNYSLEIQSADYPASYAKEKFGLAGPAYVFATACSSSGSAIIKAAQLIQAGIVDAAICGGVDVASDTVLLGFDSLEAVSENKTNPFSAARSGITLGEGAAFFLLSKDKDLARAGCGGSTDSGLANNCPVALLGWGESADASHMTAPLADGSGAFRAMKEALAFAGLDASKIDYVNLHGTGTKLNDSMEAKAVAQVFGSLAAAVPASSTKPMTGHTLGASSAVELAACWLSIVNNDKKSSAEIKLPLHVYDGNYDPDLPRLNLIGPETKFNKRINVCMSNSFGFGGCNVSLIIGKTNG
ncbi:MAG: beta-ketoacyl synthase N-terminal-like domain-containing protein [Treponema sp.]|nr:beta-ketoacyl synthase N-terminal-like domain-containing protein [Treponema sp.]MEE3435379.1 beta-ketoacyl synthase N-terminal-like domain-containing protein [Treponema sp.]